MGDLILVILLIWCVWLTLSRLKLAKEHPENADRSLTMGEKVQIWILCIFQPMWAGAILYFSWKKLLPNMAKQANRISFIVFGIEVGLFIIGIALYYWLFPTGA